MPRQAHGRPLQQSKPGKPLKRKAQNRRLNALEIAEEENPDRLKIPQHRLGEVDDDSDDPRTRADVDQRSAKRRKVATTIDDESEEGGSDLDGSRWHVGVDDEDEDSDIDSDDAFGQSDEERFADFTFRGSTNPGGKPKRSKTAPQDNLSGDEHEGGETSDRSEHGEDDDDLGDDAVDLATAWDMHDETEQEELQRRKRITKTNDYAGSDSEEDDIEDDSEADQDQSELSVSEDEGDHSRLQSFVEGLSGKSIEKGPRTRYKPQSLSDKPSQFGLGASKISAADLLQYIKDPRQRQSLKIMQNSESKGAEVYKGGIPGKLAPPLAKRQQDRLDRAAAYDKSKKELGKWIETVKQNRRAEHLSFPLQDPATTPMNSKQFAPTSQLEPMTSLESTIQAIMLESGLSSKDKQTIESQEQAYEELQEKKLPLEEVQARRAELRKVRDLMFREEIRARRIKKIKSKAYRRVHRKERDKTNLEDRARLAASGLIDSDEERERNDRRRAEERMGARHRESKWAKGIKAAGRAAWDDDARDGVNELARRDEELRRRIEGKIGNESDGYETDSSDAEELSDTDDEKDRLHSRLEELDKEESNTTHSRLASMAFMQKAEATRKAANDEEIRKARRELQSNNIESFGDSDLDNENPVGRQKFGSKTNGEEPRRQKMIEKSEFEERASDGDDFAVFEEEQNQIVLEQPVTKAAVAAGSNTDTVKGSDRNPPAVSKVQTSKQDSGRKDKVKPESSLPSSQPPQMRNGSTGIRDIILEDYTSPSESEGEDSKAALAQDIFAGPDEVTREFEKEKKDTVVDEGDQIIDNTLPGWGSWTGEGISKKAQKRAKGKFLTTIKGVAEDKRKDAKLHRVIINEKRVKKNDKYLANELPHPFESRQQYERSLRLPLGPEWTTKSTFQDATKPRVLLKQGIIRPMTRPLG